MLPSFGPPCIVGRYRLLGKVLGKGNYARVEEAVHLDLEPSEAHVAIKMIDTHTVRDPYVLRNLEREAEVLRLLRHPNIIAIFEVLKAGRYHCIVTELVGGGELCAYVRAQPRGHLDEATTLQFGAQLISALAHMHSLNVVHRDLKMKNIILTRRQDQVKIADFGLGRTWCANKPLLTHCGSPGYAAPEIYLKNSRPYGPKVDLWSLGVVLYYMAVGGMPFPPSQDKARPPDERRKHLIGLISKGATEQHVKLMGHFSPDFRDLVQGLLTASPSRRLSLQEAVEHPWVGNRLRARQLLNIQYKLSGQERALILTKLAVMLNSTVQSIDAQCRQKDLGEVAAMYNIMAHKQLSTYHASWMLRPASPRRIAAEVTAAANMGQGGPRQGPFGPYVPSGARNQHGGPQRRAGGAAAAGAEDGSGMPQVRVDQPDSSTEEDDGDEEDRAVSVRSEPEAPPQRPLPAPRQRLALQGLPRAEPRVHERAKDAVQDQGAQQRLALQALPRAEPRVHEKAKIKGEHGTPSESPQEAASVTSTDMTVVASAVLVGTTNPVDTVRVETADVGTVAQTAAKSVLGQDTEYELACLLTDGSGHVQLEALPETRVMFYTETVLDNIDDALYNTSGATKADGKVLVNAATTTTSYPIKSALASQTGLAAKTRKAVSFSIITTTHSADSGAEGSAAVQEEPNREFGVQANLKAPSARSQHGEEAKVESGSATNAHGHIADGVGVSHSSDKVDNDNANDKNLQRENISHGSSEVRQKDMKSVQKEEKISRLDLSTEKISLENPPSSLQLKNCLTPENIAATEKLLRTVPVSRKVSPEPKKHIYETRRWPLKSPREVYKRMKGHPKLSVSYLLCDQENFTLSKTNVEYRQPQLSTDNSTSLPTHKEDSDENENACTNSTTHKNGTEDYLDNMRISSLSEVQPKSEVNHENMTTTHAKESGFAHNIGGAIKSFNSEKDNISNEENKACTKEEVYDKDSNSKKSPMGAVAELVRSKIGSLRVKQKYMEMKRTENTQSKFHTRERRNKPPKYQRYFSNSYRVDLALVMTLERSRRNILPSIHGPWRPSKTDTLGKYPEGDT